MTARRGRNNAAALLLPAAQLVREVATIVPTVAAPGPGHAETVGAGEILRLLTGVAAVIMRRLFVSAAQVAMWRQPMIVALRRLVAIVAAVVVAVAVEMAERAAVVGAAELGARADGAAERGRLVCRAPLLILLLLFFFTVAVTVANPGLRPRKGLL